jgi:hypothetical protein
VVQPEAGTRNFSLWSHVCPASQFFHEALGSEGEFNTSFAWLTRFKLNFSLPLAWIIGILLGGWQYMKVSNNINFILPNIFG